MPSIPRYLPCFYLKKGSGNMKFLKSSRAFSNSNFKGNPNKSWWTGMNYQSPRGRQSQLPLCTHYLEFVKKKYTNTDGLHITLTMMDDNYRYFFQRLCRWKHNPPKWETRRGYSQQKKASGTERRNSERNRLINDEIDLGHSCSWNYFPLKTNGSHQLYILSSCGMKK